MRYPSAMLALSFLTLAPARAQQAPPAPLARLQANIDRITKSLNADWGIYIKCLETGEEISINADRQMDTMSVIKIPLMVEAFRQIEAGKFSLSDKVTLQDSDKRPGTGIIRSLDAGAVLTIKDLLTLMIIVSDNTATDLIFQKVGGIEPVNELAKSYGLTHTRAVALGADWFQALAAAPSRDQFHADGKTSVRPVFGRRHRQAARDAGARSGGQQAGQRSDARHAARAGIQLAAAEVCHRLPCAAQNRRFSAVHRQRRGHSREPEPKRHHFHFHRASLWNRRQSGRRHRARVRAGGQLLRVSLIKRGARSQRAAFTLV